MLILPPVILRLLADTEPVVVKLPAVSTLNLLPILKLPPVIVALEQVKAPSGVTWKVGLVAAFLIVAPTIVLPLIASA